NNLGLGNTDVVPAKLIDTAYMETASDDWYVDFDDDGVPDMAIGRLPVRNAAEAARVVAKIIGYGSQPAAHSALFVSDTNDSYDFTGSNAAFRPLMPPTLKVAEIQRGSSDDAT